MVDASLSSLFGKVNQERNLGSSSFGRSGKSARRRKDVSRTASDWNSFSGGPTSAKAEVEPFVSLPATVPLAVVSDSQPKLRSHPAPDLSAPCPFVRITEQQNPTKFGQPNGATQAPRHFNRTINHLP